LSDFCVIGCANCAVLQIFLEVPKVKEQHRKHKKRVCDSLLQFFWKNNSSTPLVNSSLISCSFLVHFEWLKIWWVCQLKLYKTCLYYSNGKDYNDRRS
jgi:hypothetical protein